MRHLIFNILFISTVFGQFNHEFIMNANINSGGSAVSVAVGSDGTVFLAASDGLWAYSFDGSSFTNTAYIFDTPHGNELGVSSDGTVFLVASDGLWAYSYNGSSFTNTAHIFDTPYGNGLGVNSDGIVFLAASNGLWAYSYDGSSFTNTAYINEWEGNDAGGANGVAIGSDGTIFVAAISGLHVYAYDGSSLANTAHINDTGSAKDVSIGPDGTIFLAGSGGPMMSPMLFALSAFISNDSTFTNTANISPWGEPVHCVMVGLAGTVYLAGMDGLHAYSYDDTSFTNTAYINSEGYSGAVGPDDTIFLAGDGGLIAYSYSPSTGIDDQIHLPNDFVCHQNYPNPFNPTTTIQYSLPEASSIKLTVFDIRGQEVTILQNTAKPPGNYEAQWNGMDGSGNPVSTGVYFARLEAGSHSQTIKMLYLR